MKFLIGVCFLTIIATVQLSPIKTKSEDADDLVKQLNDVDIPASDAFEKKPEAGEENNEDMDTAIPDNEEFPEFSDSDFLEEHEDGDEDEDEDEEDEQDEQDEDMKQGEKVDNEDNDQKDDESETKVKKESKDETKPEEIPAAVDDTPIAVPKEVVNENVNADDNPIKNKIENDIEALPKDAAVKDDTGALDESKVDAVESEVEQAFDDPTKLTEQNADTISDELTDAEKTEIADEVATAAEDIADEDTADTGDASDAEIPSKANMDAVESELKSEFPSDEQVADDPTKLTEQNAGAILEDVPDAEDTEISHEDDAEKEELDEAELPNLEEILDDNLSNDQDANEDDDDDDV
jgi:hypothetical protein